MARDSGGNFADLAVFVLTNGREHPLYPRLHPETPNSFARKKKKKGLLESLMSAGDVIPASDISSNSS